MTGFVTGLSLVWRLKGRFGNGRLQGDRRAITESREMRGVVTKTDRLCDFREYEAQVRLVAKAFLFLGLEKHHSVCILGFNSPEWFITDMAAIYAG